MKIYNDIYIYMQITGKQISISLMHYFVNIIINCPCKVKTSRIKRIHSPTIPWDRSTVLAVLVGLYFSHSGFSSSSFLLFTPSLQFYLSICSDLTGYSYTSLHWLYSLFIQVSSCTIQSTQPEFTSHCHGLHLLLPSPLGSPPVLSEHMLRSYKILSACLCSDHCS